MKKQFFIILSLFFLFFGPKEVLAEDPVQFITLVNPVRISRYNPDSEASVRAQYKEVQVRDLPATWLLTYDAILDKGIEKAVKQFEKNHELGIFMEITPKLASASGVVYNQTDSWHRANSVFLSGYRPEDRQKIIDTVFERFKEIFGYFPSSVGAWWVDSYSLQYMQAKYNITANLTCADQFSTDGYQLWGQFWSTPFYPSKNHSGIPARTLDTKLNVVTLQWASRDPLNGYGKGDSSLYSAQDYLTLGLKDDYLEKLIDLYGRKHGNSYGQITLGLEGDFPAEGYRGAFARQMEIVKKLQARGDFKVTTMKEFSMWYRNNFRYLSPSHFIETKDLLGKKLRVMWYQSPAYRINLIYEEEKKEIVIYDLRFYNDNFTEPHRIIPNKQIDLEINIPALIDSASNDKDGWHIPAVLENIEKNGSTVVLKLRDRGIIRLRSEGLGIENIEIEPPQIIKDLPLGEMVKSGRVLEILSPAHGRADSEGYFFNDLTSEATYFLKQKKLTILEGLGLVAIMLVTAILWKSRIKILTKIIILPLAAFISITIYNNWKTAHSQQYFVHPEEIAALLYLSGQPEGRVAVYDGDCLQCGWEGTYRPAVFANKRSYVSKFSQKSTVYNQTIFTAKTRKEGKSELNKLGVKYIYLVKYGNYFEKLPFSPGDYDVTKIYNNAYTEIWRIK